MEEAVNTNADVKTELGKLQNNWLNCSWYHIHKYDFHDIIHIFEIFEIIAISQHYIMIQIKNIQMQF